MKKIDFKFYQTYKLYIFPAVVSLSSLFLIVFAIIPQTAKLLENQRSVGELSAKSKLLEAKVSALESYDENDLSSKVGFVLSSLPADKDFVNILGLLQNLTGMSGYSVTAISVAATSGKPGKTSNYTVKLEVTGARALFQTLLYNLENSPRLIRVDNIDISSNQASGVLNAALTLQVLYAQLPQNLGTEDSPLPKIDPKDEELLTSLSQFSQAAGRAEATQSSMLSSPRGKSNPFE